MPKKRGPRAKPEVPLKAGNPAVAWGRPRKIYHSLYATIFIILFSTSCQLIASAADGVR